MRTLVLSIAVMITAPALISAEETVGRLTAQEGVRLDGVILPSAAIPYWPLHAGSVVETGAHPAIIMLGGGKRYEVEPHSRVRVDGSMPSGASIALIETSERLAAGSTPSSAVMAQVRTAPSAAPAVSQLIEISVVDNDNKGDLGAPPAGPPCAGFPPILVSLGLVRCTP